MKSYTKSIEKDYKKKLPHHPPQPPPTNYEVRNKYFLSVVSIIPLYTCFVGLSALDQKVIIKCCSKHRPLITGIPIDMKLKQVMS